MAVFYEDVAVGDTVVIGSKTITETDLVAFSAMTGDFGPLHMDREFAEKTQFGGRIAHGLMGTTYALGLMFTANIFPGAVIAFMEVVSWKFLKPIFIGDTVTCRHIIAEKTETSKSDRGIILRRMEIVNQRNEVVQDGVFKYLIRRRPSA